MLRHTIVEAYTWLLKITKTEIHSVLLKQRRYYFASEMKTVWKSLLNSAATEEYVFEYVLIRA